MNLIHFSGAEVQREFDINDILKFFMVRRRCRNYKINSTVNKIPLNLTKLKQIYPN